MIPSDHFVRFYNEVFKFLDEKGELQQFYDEISRHQEFHCLKDFTEKKLQGVYDYYVKIRKEENCDMDLIFDGKELMLRMNTCPSLSKAMDNDAGVCPKYCKHCSWLSTVLKRAGLYHVYDLMGMDQPHCCSWVYEDIELAKARYNELLKIYPAEDISRNFTDIP